MVLRKYTNGYSVKNLSDVQPVNRLYGQLLIYPGKSMP